MTTHTTMYDHTALCVAKSKYSIKKPNLQRPTVTGKHTNFPILPTRANASAQTHQSKTNLLLIGNYTRTDASAHV